MGETYIFQMDYVDFISHMVQIIPLSDSETFLAYFPLYPTWFR